MAIQVLQYRMDQVEYIYKLSDKVCQSHIKCIYRMCVGLQVAIKYTYDNFKRFLRFKRLFADLDNLYSQRLHVIDIVYL